jgi:hypothetical protein
MEKGREAQQLRKGGEGEEEAENRWFKMDPSESRAHVEGQPNRLARTT